MFWSYLFVGAGQLLVALVFGEIVYAVSDCRRTVSMGATVGGEAVGVVGGVGLLVGAVHDDCRGRGGGMLVWHYFWVSK